MKLPKPTFMVAIGLALLFSTAHAASLKTTKIEKKSERLNFNQMIDHTANQRQQLEGGVEELIAEEVARQQQEQRVIDFVEVELGWGEAPAQVDSNWDAGEQTTPVPAPARTKKSQKDSGERGPSSVATL